MSNAQQKWDKRYAAKGDLSECTSKPPEFLVRNIDQLKRGRVLDLAAGDGAVSLYLAEQGFEVVAVDISQVGLDRLETRLSNKGFKCDTAVIDLESTGADLSALGEFDAIVISRYKPVSDLWAGLASITKTNGHILLTTFNTQHHQRTGFSQRFCLAVNELQNVDDALEVILQESDRDSSGMDSYLYKKV